MTVRYTALTLLALSACQPKEAQPVAAADPAATSPIADVTSAMDRTIDPCTDFYEYACGGWRAATTLPEDKPSVVRSFTTIRDANELVIQQILEAAQADAAAGEGDADWQRLGNYYGACMDTEAVDAAGLTPLKPQLDAIDALADHDGLPRLVGQLHRAWTAPLFDMGVGPDAKDPDNQLVSFVQAGMGLPQRTYYLSDDERSVALRDGYKAHVGKMLALTGMEQAAAEEAAAEILAFETELAKVAWDPADLHDPEKTYNIYDLAGLAELAPGFDWTAYLDGLGMDDPGKIEVAAPSYLTGAIALAADADIEFLQSYMKWNTLRGNVGQLGATYYDEYFDFYDKQLSGVSEPRPRWKRCVDATNGAVGDLVSQAYIEQRFAGDSKASALDMIKRIEAAFEEGLPDLQWMDDATRERAVEKMTMITNKIGYPDKWEDYSTLEVGGDYLANVMAWREFETLDMLTKIGQPPDPDEWYMPASAVNAYYNPPANEIVFPAGILQPPFFGASRIAPLNFGGIGMVVGHELTHGFDDDGRKFDGTGAMKEWWDPSVVERFEESTACVQELYDGYEYQEGMTLDGELTLGENIADIGGLRQAYRAYRAYVGEVGEPEPIDGLTGDQLFFLGFAQGWCAVSRPEYEQMLAKGDSHSLPRFRVNGPASQLTEFSAAFECAADTPMNPTDKCEVW
jgi:putative endopeptidase